MWAFLCDRIETTPGLEIYLISLQELLVEYSLLVVCPMTSSLELDREKIFHEQEMTSIWSNKNSFFLHIVHSVDLCLVSLLPLWSPWGQGLDLVTDEPETVSPLYEIYVTVSSGSSAVFSVARASGKGTAGLGGVGSSLGKVFSLTFRTSLQYIFEKC